MYKRLIPSILISDGRLVKGTRYRGFKDAGGPATTARAHNHQGADELVVCDITASRKECEPDYETIAKVAAESFMPLTVFGGINNLERAARMMEIGADKLGLTSTALDNPDLIQDLAYLYGTQAVVIGIDAVKDENGYRLYNYRNDHIIRERDLMDWVQEVVDRGCGEIRIMAVDREGGLEGLDLDLYEQIAAKVNIPLILEGGAGSLEHIEQAYKAGVEAVAVGAMLVFSDANLVKIKQHMRTRGIDIRF